MNPNPGLTLALTAQAANAPEDVSDIIEEQERKRRKKQEAKEKKAGGGFQF